MALSLIVIISLGKQLYMYFSFTFTGANCQYWRSIQDDAIPKEKWKTKGTSSRDQMATESEKGKIQCGRDGFPLYFLHILTYMYMCLKN